MYQLIMTVILIATFAAITVMGVNTMRPTAMTRITDAEKIVSEQLRLSLAIQTYRRAHDDLPASAGWIEAIDPYLNAEPRSMPEGISWSYIRIGEEFSLCARGTNAWSSDGLKSIACAALPERFQKMPQVLVATPGRTYLAPGELPAGGLSVTLAPYRITLRNDGASSVTISAASMSAGTAYKIEGTNCIGALAPGASCSVDYVFTSGSSGPVEDTMTIFSNAV